MPDTFLWKKRKKEKWNVIVLIKQWTYKDIAKFCNIYWVLCHPLDIVIISIHRLVWGIIFIELTLISTWSIVAGRYNIKIYKLFVSKPPANVLGSHSPPNPSLNNPATGTLAPAFCMPAVRFCISHHCTPCTLYHTRPLLLVIMTGLLCHCNSINLGSLLSYRYQHCPWLDNVSIIKKGITALTIGKNGRSI